MLHLLVGRRLDKWISGGSYEYTPIVSREYSSCISPFAWRL